ncbi:MAG TPA: SIMPL domain-containing protein [Rubrivivax sp.]|nr:SIMPL domain-containing protein [Burkholderiales bacterium]HNT37709.1 SIMPL domain-containing protein [Rubrivivax sp.]
MTPPRPCRLPARLALAPLLLATALPALGQTTLATTTAPQNVVGLSATATMEVQKDLLTLVFSTSREGPDASQLQAQLKQALDEALTVARAAAKPGRLEVQTGDFSIHPRYTAKGPSGWSGSAELVVEGSDMVAVSQLAGRIQSMTIARSSFGLSREKREQVDAELTAQAIARFKARAEEVARLFGFSGWTLREVTVQGADLPPMRPMARVAMAAAAPGAEGALPFEAGKATVSASVSGSVQLSAR